MVNWRSPERSLKVVIQISPIPPNEHQIDPPDPIFHNPYKATLKNGDVWAVDTTERHSISTLGLVAIGVSDL